MNKHLLKRDMAQSEALKAVEMDDARIAEIQMACEATAKYAEWYRVQPVHPSVSEQRASRRAQFLEAYHALKGLIE